VQLIGMRVSLSRILLQAMALLNPPPLGLNPDQSLCFASAARTVPTGMSFSTSPLKFKGAGLWLVHRIAGLPRHHYLVLPCPEDAKRRNQAASRLLRIIPCRHRLREPGSTSPLRRKS
jgi:hypothetical protein